MRKADLIISPPILEKSFSRMLIVSSMTSCSQTKFHSLNVECNLHWRAIEHSVTRKRIDLLYLTTAFTVVDDPLTSDDRVGSENLNKLDMATAVLRKARGAVSL